MTQLEKFIPHSTPAGQVLDPRTGELLSLEDVPKVADLVTYLRELKSQANELLNIVTEGVAEVCAQQGTKTLAKGGAKLELASRSETVWDVDELHQLTTLGLPLERFDDLVEATVEYKVDGRVARQIASSNPEYAKVIENAKSTVEKRPWLKVKP